MVTGITASSAYTNVVAQAGISTRGDYQTGSDHRRLGMTRS